MLTVKNLQKTFGKTIAVEDVTFEVQPGEILGLVGPNGSGKTTIFRMILNFLTPEKGGVVYWNGKKLSARDYNDVGYLPEERGLYEDMTIENQIIYFAQLKGMSKDEAVKQVDLWMKKFAVKGKKTDKIKTLSKGNQQKVQLINTLIHQPKLVILDEPFSGLDPVNADLLKQGIIELRSLGSAVIFSSHNMNNVEEICDKVIMITNGVQRLYGDIEEVRESFGRTNVWIESEHWTASELKELPGVESVEKHKKHQFKMKLTDESYGDSLFKAITGGKYIPMFVQQPPSLEEIFKRIAGDIVE